MLLRRDTVAGLRLPMILVKAKVVGCWGWDSTLVHLEGDEEISFNECDDCCTLLTECFVSCGNADQLTKFGTVDQNTPA